MGISHLLTCFGETLATKLFTDNLCYYSKYKRKEASGTLGEDVFRKPG